MRRLWIRASLFGTACLSTQAVVIFAPIGVLVTMLAAAPSSGVAFINARWWLVALASQAVFTGMVFVFARLAHRDGHGWQRVGVLALAGAARGAAIAWSADALGVQANTASGIASRSLNSAIACIIWLGAIGLLLQGTRDFRSAYAELMSNAVAVHRAALGGPGEVDPEVLQHWERARESVAAASARALDRLAAGRIDPDELASAAELIAEAVSRDVRPMSHGLWFGALDRPPRLRMVAVLRECMQPWNPPILDIMFVLIPVSIVGSLLHAGPAIGAVYSAVTLIAALAILAVSARAGRRWPDAGTAVGGATAAALIAMDVIAALVIGSWVFAGPADIVGAVLGALVLVVVVLGAMLLRRMDRERQMLLEALILRTDAEALRVRARMAAVREGDSQIGEYLHHSVQSELAAVALSLGEAARSGDHANRSAAVIEARARLERLSVVDPPWAGGAAPRDRIFRIVAAWQGIVRIDVDLPPESEATPDQWRIAALAIEEALGNAIRAGGARRIGIEGSIESKALRVSVIDDGQHAPAGGAGMGTAWLDQHVPNAWSRRRDPRGTVLELRID